MSETNQHDRDSIERFIREQWGDDRAAANAGLIESAANAIARVNALRPEATSMLDGLAGDDDDERV